MAMEVAPATPQSDAVLTKATIPVEGMVCVSCAASIKHAVKNVEGVTDAAIDFANRTIRVTFRPGQPVLLDNVKAAISNLGFKPGTAVAVP
jgi:copper chaperone CopZ